MTPLPVQPDPETEAVFERVLEPVTMSIVKPIVRRKLNVSLRPNDTSCDNQDALELVGDIQVALLVELSNERSIDESRIRDLKSYAAAVTANACYQYFRSKFPVWTQQKNKIRYFLTHNDDFTLWRDTGSGKWICGYADWEHTGRQAVGVPSVRADETESTGEINERNVLLSLIALLFDELGGPVPLDDLTGYVMAKRGIHEHIELPDETDRPGRRSASDLGAAGATAESALVQIASLKQLWLGVLQLPLRHRKALLLNIKDPEGQGLISVLPASGVASMAAIAEALEFSPGQFAEIWNTLPWSDLSIADHLRLTRQQVINLRQSARARLARLDERRPNQY